MRAGISAIGLNSKLAGPRHPTGDREAEVTDTELDDRRAQRHDEPAAQQSAESALCAERLASSLPRRSPIVTAMRASWTLRAGTPMGGDNCDSTQSVGLHLWVFYTDMRRMNRTKNETAQLRRPGRTHDPGLVYCLVRGGGGCGIRTREGLHPTRFPSVGLSVRDRPGTSVTWNSRNWRVTADARELRRMRLRMRLRLKRRTDSCQPGPRALAPPDAWRARVPEAIASDRAGDRQSSYADKGHHTE